MSWHPLSESAGRTRGSINLEERMRRLRIGGTRLERFSKGMDTALHAYFAGDTRRCLAEHLSSIGARCFGDRPPLLRCFYHSISTPLPLHPSLPRTLSAARRLQPSHPGPLRTGLCLVYLLSSSHSAARVPFTQSCCRGPPIRLNISPPIHLSPLLLLAARRNANKTAAASVWLGNGPKIA
jgi:hypothetical protein